MLYRLPGELLAAVIGELPKKDLKALSLVSQYMRKAVEKDLWQSVTVIFRAYGKEGADLPSICFPIATQLHFRDEALLDQCPHRPEEEAELWGESDSEEENYRGYRWDFDLISQNASSVLDKFRKDQLDTFSWEINSCIPSTILGRGGLLALNQTSIKSLSLTTDPTCSLYYETGCDIDLSSFRQLHSLTWKAPNTDNLPTISHAVCSNASQLQKLELDFVDWPALRNALDYESDDDNDDGEDQEQSYFTREILFLHRRRLQPYFPNIRVISLSHVPLGAALAGEINFETLVSLSLRLCHDWDRFLERVLSLSVPIRLRLLEIQASDSVTFGSGDYVVRDFLDKFQGLEELSLCEIGPQEGISFYNHLVPHKVTLRKLVHHQRTIDTNENSPHFEEEMDLPDLSIVGRDVRHIKERPSENPLAQLDLEFIGLACLPERLKYILLPFRSKSCLKVVHIRQSRTDLNHRQSWVEKDRPVFITMQTETGEPQNSDSEEVDSEELDSEAPDEEGSEIDSSTGSWADSGPRSEAESFAEPDVDDVGVEQKEMLNRLRPEFRQFAEWIFGPQGVPSVQLVVYGDFSYGGRDHKITLQRSTTGRINFRSLNFFHPEWEEALYKYRHELGVCPIGWSLEGDPV